jgi:asparagine synthase (glutamine-hydrolysing)
LGNPYQSKGLRGGDSSQLVPIPLDRYIYEQSTYNCQEHEMCGIAGWAGYEASKGEKEAVLNALKHRGPDSHGFWQENDVWLGHRRLAIIDLSTEGHQPKLSSTQRFVVTFNGEIFNYLELRAELSSQGRKFRGESDTEVLLEAIEHYGFKVALEKLNGMFSIAVWDREEGTLTLARDRMGEKPLYYSISGEKIAFASELTGLMKINWIDKRVDRTALNEYFSHLCVPGNHSIIVGARKLEPGNALIWRRGEYHVEPFWELKEKATSSADFVGNLSESDYVDGLIEILSDAVRIRTRSDVPLGILLSSGIDSSIIASMLKETSTQRFSTYTVGLEDLSFDEGRDARKISNLLESDHHELILRPKEIIESLEDIITHFDEPFADSSSIPTYHISKFASSYVKVALGGDGGDELFAGYPRYFWADRIERIRAIAGKSGASAIGSALKIVPQKAYNLVDRVFLHGRRGGALGLGMRAHRFADYLMFEPEQLPSSVYSVWKQDGPPFLLNTAGVSDFQRFVKLPTLNWSECMMLSDQMFFLPDDILTKTDRASMAFGLELRSPLLDHRIVEWSWRLPRSLKLVAEADNGKNLLRKAVSRYIPASYFNRAKKGFSIPLASWLRVELREWVEGFLSAECVRGAGLDERVVRDIWIRHLAGEDFSSKLWTILVWIVWSRSRKVIL